MNRRSNVLCKSFTRFFTHCFWYFGPFLPCRSPLEHVMFWWLSMGNIGHFQLPPRFSMGLRSGDWLRTTPGPWNASYEAQLLRLPGRGIGLFGIIVMLKDPATFHLPCPSLDGRRFSLKISRYIGPFILSFTQISSFLVPLQKNSPQSMMFHPHASQ